MRPIHKYVRSVFTVIFSKVRYGNRVNIGMVQTFDRVRFELDKEARVSIGSFNQNRGFLYIGVPGGTLTIGNHCFFNINSSITCAESVIIGNNCKFGNNLVIVDHDHNFRSESPEFVSSPITIGNDVWAGADVTILRGSKIGNNCVIGAGTIVSGEVPDNTILIQKRENSYRTIERR